MSRSTGPNPWRCNCSRLPSAPVGYPPRSQRVGDRNRIPHGGAAPDSRREPRRGRLFAGRWDWRRSRQSAPRPVRALRYIQGREERTRDALGCTQIATEGTPLAFLAASASVVKVATPIRSRFDLFRRRSGACSGRRGRRVHQEVARRPAHGLCPDPAGVSDERRDRVGNIDVSAAGPVPRA